MISGSAFAAGALLALAGCAGHGIVPSSSAPLAPTAMSPATFDSVSPLRLPTCAKTPPQYDWIFKGACNLFTLAPAGGTFRLKSYQYISVSGLIGRNTLKGSVQVAIADAIDNGDVTKWGKLTFPPYKAAGTTVVYAAVNNQSKDVIKPNPEKNKPILQYTIADAKGFPGRANVCGAALLTQGAHGSLVWSPFPGTGTIKNDSVTITVYVAPKGFELPPQGSPLYFAINCYKR